MPNTTAAVRAYRTAEPYAGFACFAFDLNRTLRLQGASGLDTNEKLNALQELDQSFVSSQTAIGEFTLYRGACGNTVTPFFNNNIFKNPAFSSSTFDILTAVRLAHSCDSLSEGAPYLFKIIYPKGIPRTHSVIRL